MSINRFKLKLISPAFIAGSNKNIPEMRASSVRGQLRYWLRAIIGAQNPDLTHIHTEEEKIFGSTNRGSPISVRVYGNNPEPKDVAMLPHRDKGKQSYQPALPKDTEYDLELVSYPGEPISSKLLGTLYLWSLMGGIGKRSRRMFGSIDITPIDNKPSWWHIPRNGNELADTISGILSLLSKDVYEYRENQRPLFPTLHPNHSWVIVGRLPQGSKNPYDDYKDAIEDLFRKLLRTQDFKDNPVFGGVNPRRASPLIAQIKCIKGNYYPVLTAIRSEPSHGMNWNIMHQFMEQAKDIFGGETVWGGW